MRIDIGQTTNLFHVNALNKGISRGAGEEQEKTNILPRRDTAVISPMGRASSMLQKLADQIELRQEGLDNLQYQFENGTQATFSDQNLDWKKVQQDSIYNEIIEKSDNGFNNPTIEMQLRGTYNVYLNKAYEQGKDPEVNIYDHIVNIHVDSLMKAYQDVYNDIVTGYANGTREVWTQNFEEGADYIEFELEGKNYRFHKLTMEEELDRLDRAYEKQARKAADIANLMIDTQKVIEKVMPEYEAKMREIGEQRARRLGFEIGENAEIMAERIKDKVTSEDTSEEFNIYEMLMEARTSWLKQLTETD